jgi:hypothetical protein
MMAPDQLIRFRELLTSLEADCPLNDDELEAVSNPLFCEEWVEAIGGGTMKKTCTALNYLRDIIVRYQFTTVEELLAYFRLKREEMIALFRKWEIMTPKELEAERKARWARLDKFRQSLFN